MCALLPDSPTATSGRTESNFLFSYICIYVCVCVCFLRPWIYRKVIILLLWCASLYVWDIEEK